MIVKPLLLLLLLLATAPAQEITRVDWQGESMVVDWVTPDQCTVPKLSTDNGATWAVPRCPAIVTGTSTRASSNGVVWGQEVLLVTNQAAWVRLAVSTNCLPPRLIRFTR